MPNHLPAVHIEVTAKGEAGNLCQIAMLNTSLAEQYVVLICITLSLWWPAFSRVAKGT